MLFQAVYPLVITKHVVACRDFYRDLFGFTVALEGTFLVMLTAPEGPGRLAFMMPEHPTPSPGPEAFSGKGMCFEFQVAEATAEYKRLKALGATITLPLRDEPFGQRRFGLVDPAGILIHVYEQIDPAPGWWKPYLTE